MLRALLLALLLVAAGAQAADTRMAVITLNYAEPATVVAALEGVVGPDGSVRAVDNRLVVNATPERLAQIRQVVADLDREPRTLLISVRTSGEHTSSSERYGVSGQWGNDSTRIVVNRDGSHTDTHTRVTLNRRDSNGSDSGSRTVSALEGRSAYISIGEAVPEDTYGVGPYGATRLQRDYVPVQRGFTVNARVHGDRAVVSLDYHDDRQSPSGTIHTNAAATQFAAPLGEWFPVGSVEEAGAHGERVVLGRSAAEAQRSNRIWLKIELAH